MTSVARHTNDKDLRELIRRVERVGWEVSVTNGNRFAIRPPKGDIIYASATASDHRANRNIVAQLRRAGLELAEAALEAKGTPPLEPEPEDFMEAAPTPAPTNGVPSTADPHVLGLMKLGRLVDRLPKDDKVLRQFVEVLELADQLGLTFGDLAAALKEK